MNIEILVILDKSFLNKCVLFIKFVVLLCSILCAKKSMQNILIRFWKGFMKKTELLLAAIVYTYFYI